MRYGLSDAEWAAINPMLPNKPARQSDRGPWEVSERQNLTPVVAISGG